MRSVSSPSGRQARGWIVVLCASLSWAACGGGVVSEEQHESVPAESSAQAELEQYPSAASSCELPEGGYGDSCNSCLASSCCSVIEACERDASCSTQLSCIVRCQHADDPTACSAACIPGVPDPGYVAYDDCSFQECRSSCWV